MNVLIHKDLILGFIKQNLNNKEHQKQFQQILDNQNSVFLYSTKFFSLIKEELEDDFLDEYRSIFKKISDSGEYVTISQTSQDFDDEFLHICSSSKHNVIIGIAYNPNPKITQVIPNIAVLSQQQKPNKHWLVVNLAILHPFTLSVDEIDFDKDGDIETFFNDLFSIPKKISAVTIFDDYYNVDKHQYYKKITEQNAHVYYCTEKHYPKPDRDGKLDSDKYKILKKVFSKLELWTKKYGSHARRIIFEGFIVNPDIDLDLLKKENKKMWSIYIRFSKERAEEIIGLREKDYKKSIIHDKSLETLHP